MTLQINRRQWIQSLGACLLTVSGKRLQAQTSEGYTIPILDIDGWADHQVIVDREPGQYLGHPTTVLLEDGKTILTVYPKGHGKGPIQYKKSTDAGKSWSERLPTPPNWVTSGETPTIHRVVDANGKKRLILFSGLKPIRMAVSEDDGAHWTELKPIADYGGIVPMGSVVALKDKPGHYLALFHDDGRFMNEPYRPSPKGFYVYQINSADGGLTWSEPKVVAHHPDAHLCEPGAARSPDGKQIAVLLRENSRKHNSFLITSEDEGQTWSKPKELPAALTGDRHTAAYARDGRLLISFRDTTRKSPTKGDWVAWVGRYEDIIAGREGEYRVRIKQNHKSADCAYPGVEILADDTFVLTTYGHWTPTEQPYILSVRVRLDELDQLKSRQK
ncbi:MAG: sialidase family protein [Planctomycetota bacterium]|nr:sialidase family protein [Planctomycetota bacterium]